jgi:hypothetical protein
MLEGQRLTVTGTVLRLSTRRDWAGIRIPTVMLGQVKDTNGQLLTDHVWLPVGKRLALAELHLGDIVQFSARVLPYRRGLARTPGEPLRFSEDSKLGYVTGVQVLVRHIPEAQNPPAPRTSPTNAQRVLARIADLWQADGEPPSLTRLVLETKVNPLTTISTLRKLAKAGFVVFQPDGSVFVRGAHSQEGVLA